jgi:acetyl-CoA acetyltransferase
MVLLALEDWGFCGDGESGAFVERGGIRWPDGRLPVNTHGGQLSEAFIHGFNNLLEAVRQIRGTSTCQVPDARIAFVASAASDPGGAVLFAR